MKVLRKFQKKYQKISTKEDSRRPKGALRGATPWPDASLARRGGWPHPLTAWARGEPLRLPFGIYLVPETETLGETPVTQFHPLFRRHRDSELGIARRTSPGTLSEGGLTSGGFSITMIASGMRCE